MRTLRTIAHLRRRLLLAALLGLAALPGALPPGRGSVRADDDVAAQARAALDAGNPREAIALLEKAIAKRSSDDLLALRGEARLDLGKTRDAKADLERVAKTPEGKKKVAGLRARIEFLYGNDVAARALLEDAPEDDADRTTLPVLMTGPFAPSLGDVAPIGTGRTASGHYLVYSDVGLTPEVLEKAQALVAAEKAKGPAGLDARIASVLKPGAGVREGGKLLETIYRAYDNVFPFEKDTRLVHRVYIFSKRADFIAFAKSIGEDMEGADGFYRSDTRILVIDGEEFPDGKETFADNTKDTIFHEGFHQFVRFHAPGLPTWLDEGLAEYFGPSKVLPGGKLDVGVVKKTDKGDRGTRYEEIVEAIGKKAYTPLARFFTISDEDFVAEDRISLHYAQAWSVIHFLVTKADRRPLVVDYFKAIRAGKTREQAFAETFGKEDMKALEKEWREYVLGL